MTFVNYFDVPDKAILDIFGRQTYLGNSFLSGTQLAAAGATTETPYILLINPSTNTKSMFLHVKKFSASGTTIQNAVFRSYANPTITSNGTAQGIFNLRANASSPASTMQVFKTPTVSANGTFIADLSATTTIGPVESNVLSIIDPGNVIYITVTASVNSLPVAAEFIWYEI